MTRRFWWGMMASLPLLGCASDDSAGAHRSCEPGATVSCACIGGGQGTQACRADGKGYEACLGCDGSGGAAGAGGSASGGASGAGGSGGAFTGKRTGAVTLDGNSLRDDQGRFNALGATMMWAAWGFKNDRARLEQNLQWLSQHGFHYIRALGVVGDYGAADYWDGREIDWHWPDYDAVIAGLTDLCYDTYGLRVEWTLIGDGQKNLPNAGERQALVDRFVAMSQGRSQKIIHFELANEAWQNGFDGSAGQAELRALTQDLNSKSSILVAASAPNPTDCGATQALYAGGIADIATLHFDRDVGQKDGHWRPVWQPWWVQGCAGVPVSSNNEPIGPGASVSSENDALKLVAGAAMSFVSGLPLHVFHSSAGVRGDANLWEMSGADAFVAISSYVPPDVASWQRKDPKQADAPLRIFAEEGGQPKPDQTWPELGQAESGVVAAYGAQNGKSFVMLPIGVLNHVKLEARAALTLDVVDLISGAVVSQHALAQGESFTLSGAEARWLRGTLQ
ncbi:MAG: hypothetical protein R3B13_03150 [Polyangiaceae bacterium]